MSSLTDIIRNRRSVRRFTEQEVPVDLIKRIVEDATYAPTSCNQQLWKFIAVTEQNLKNRLVAEAFSSTNVARAPVVLVGCYDAWDKKEAIQGASFATQNILLSATDLGIGCCPVNSFGNEKTIKKILNIPNEYLINCLILLGYPDEIYKTIPHVKRRPYTEVISFNEFEFLNSPSRSYNTRKWKKEKLIDYQKYYCRKTFLGKEMDIMDDLERELVKNILKEVTKDKQSIIDFFSYDGCMLRLFPDKDITSVNLDVETQAHVKAAVDIYCKENNSFINYMLFDDIYGKYDLATMIFKIERLPKTLLDEGYNYIKKHLAKNGELIIITRRCSILFNLYYRLIILLFGDDIRKTGLYAFWGPYKPIRTYILKKGLKRKGFEIISSEKYFSIPPFFNQVLQMFFQFIKSGGTSYLHREKHVNFLTKLFDFLIKREKIKPSLFGSILVLRLKNNV